MKNNPPQDEIEELLNALGMKTPREDVNMKNRSSVLDFLKTEQTNRQHYRIKRLLSSSGIRPHQIRTFDEFDWAFNPKLPKNDILAFRNSQWIDQASNLILIGDAGLGKSHFGKALCYDAMLKGESAHFISAFDLISKVKNATRPDVKVTRFGSYYKILCIDELGYTKPTKEAGDILFQIIAKRSESLPTIITTNLAPKNWGCLFAGSAATAILDRMSFNGSFITMEGPSYRMKSKRK